MSTIQADFDRLALLDAQGWTQNNHYHNFLLRHVRDGCQNALEVGCGTGAFARRLAERAPQVVALDLSPEMIRVARSRSTDSPNLEVSSRGTPHFVFRLITRSDCVLRPD